MQQLARVGVRVILVDVVCVMLAVLIAHVDVVHAVDTVFVAILCSGRCTLYRRKNTPLIIKGKRTANLILQNYNNKMSWRISGSFDLSTSKSRARKDISRTLISYSTEIH